jgi:flagellar biosynthesis protein FlhG
VKPENRKLANGHCKLKISEPADALEITLLSNLQWPIAIGQFAISAMDQATHLRQLVREAVDRHGDLAPGAPLVVVTGAQPGIGATTIACGLARELAALGKQVVLIDANLAAPAVAAEFATSFVNSTPLGSLADVLAGARRAVEILIAPAENIRVLPGAPLTETTQLNLEALTHIQSELAALCRQSDIVLVDAGAGMSPWIDRLWQLAQHVLLVAAPASSTVVDAYAALKQSHREGASGKLQLVVTRCDAAADAARIHAGFSDTCQRFLDHAVKPPAVLPTIDIADAAPFARSLRLLAADLACDFRSLAARLPARTARTTPHLNPSMRITHLTPRQ